MNRTIARCLYGVLFAGGLTLFGATAAHAADTSGDNGALSGTLVDTVVTVPGSVGGNAVSVLGDSNSDAAPTSAPAAETAPGGSSTSGNDAIASGSQVSPVVSVPVTVGGNSASLVGNSTSTDASTPAPAPAPSGSTSATTSGNDSVGGGSQITPALTAPVTVGGNAFSVLGDSSTSGSTADSAGGASVPAESIPTTSGNKSALGGTQVVPVVTAPVGVRGNAVSVVGDSESGTSVDAMTPAEPSTPVIPAEPVTPATPAEPTNPSALASASLSSLGAEGALGAERALGAVRATGSAWADSVTLAAASAAPKLADTGSQGASALVPFSALMMLAGAAAALLGSKRAAQRI